MSITKPERQNIIVLMLKFRRRWINRRPIPCAAVLTLYFANPWPPCYSLSMTSDPNAVTMNVSLPKPLKRYVDGRVSSGVYGSASEFVREAIREKLQRERRNKLTTAGLTAKLLEGLDSGQPINFTGDYFARKKQALVSRIKAKKKGA